MKQLLIAILSILTVLFTACGPSVEGTGNVVKKEHQLDEFSNIKISGGFEVQLRQGNRNEVIIETDENLHEHIEVFVEDNKLIIEPKQRLRKAEELIVYITTKDIRKIDLNGAVELKTKSKIKSKSLSIDGSGAVEINADVDTKRLNIDISGASEIDLSGNCDRLSIDISGAGEVSAYDLIAEEASINISGAGSAQVNVKKELEVDITGAGKVDYKGNPEVDQHIAGAGSVQKK